MIRIGTGWDIHKLEEGRKLILGGVQIESPKGCLGHSDGDALIHAIIDALLGAAGLDDIGTQFPDSKDEFKDIDSEILLKRTLNLIKDAGYEIINIDSTVILQSPKLGPYKSKIKKEIAQCLGINEGLVSIKAKTAEKMLGELGTSDAVVAQASVLIQQ